MTHLQRVTRYFKDGALKTTWIDGVVTHMDITITFQSLIDPLQIQDCLVEGDLLQIGHLHDEWFDMAVATCCKEYIDEFGLPAELETKHDYDNAA